jgi:hypothetical protein
MTRTLYLHIGTGKAGSTTIQNQLMFLNEPSHGVLPVSQFGRPNAMRLVAACAGNRGRNFFVERRKVLTEEEYQENAREIWPLAKEEVRSALVDKFVASSEFLVSKVRGRDILFLRGCLYNVFDRVEIIVYLREQISFLRSLWAQTVKGPTKSYLTFGEFIETLDGRAYQWDYSIFLKQWQDVFGADAVQACVFDNAAFYNGDLLSDFFNRIGMSTVPGPREGSGNGNVTPTVEELDQIRHDNLVDFANRLGTPPPEMTPSQSVDDEYYRTMVMDRVSESNKWVNETVLQDQKVKLPVL